MMINTIKAILVDDEARARRSLGKLLSRFCPEVEILGEAAHVDDAVDQIHKHRPDMVFLDIEMPVKSGFELINAFQHINFHIVFVTAYDQYALKAFEVSAIDYLLKPVAVDRLKDAVHKVVVQQQRKNYEARFEALQTNTQNTTLKKLAIPYKSDYAIVNIEDIITIEADRMYSRILVSDPKTAKNYIYSKKLSYFEDLLDQLPYFQRIHRSWILNTRYIASYSKKDYRIMLKNNMEIPLGRSYKQSFEAFFGF